MLFQKNSRNGVNRPGGICHPLADEADSQNTTTKEGAKEMTKEGAKEMRIRLKLLRVSKGMSQEEFAKAIGVTRSYYRTVEAGENQGSLNFWLSIKDGFAIPASELFELMKVEAVE